jgi:hypothetical protein
LDGDLTANGVYRDSTGIARHIYILDVGTDDQTGATYTITGTGPDNDALVEAILGPASTGFVITTGRFSRVDSITIASPAAGSTTDIGVNGHFTSADGLGHRLDIIGSAHVQTGSTYTITGTNSNGQAQTEDIAGPGSGATIETVKYFLTVSSLVTDVPVASSTIDFGTVDEIVSPVYPLNWRGNTAATIAITGTVGTYVADIQETFNDIYTNGISSATWFDVHADENADMSGVLTLHATAVRIHTDSYTDTAELQFHINQLEYTT